MSAYQVSDEHINAIVTALATANIIEKDDREPIARLLLKENIKSVNYRYNMGKNIDAIVFHLKFKSKKLSLYNVYKLVGCYEYQSCEHPTWEQSKAKSLCDSLNEYILANNKKGYKTNDIMVYSPEYDKAKWSI